MPQVADVQKTNLQLMKTTANYSKIGDHIQAGEGLTQKPDSRFYRYNLHDHTSWTNLTQITDAKRTTVRLMKSKVELKVGDQIQVRLEARDKMGNTKAYGGDFIRIKLSSDETRSYVNPDYIIDNGNGTYDAFFTLRWPGSTQIDAMLVHPSEAVSVINRLIQNMPNRLAYDAKYTHPKTNQEEITRCDVVVPSQKEYCNYSDPRNFAPWYCEKPTTPGIKCNNLPRICTNVARARKIVGQNATPLEREAIKR
ncbi:NXPE family member 3 [Holothuria leucospilota]|uniref:NXPE family member 3 n=1 Tax=Holothuria leucospilota TaxID=206669 RepID=A0A9Q1C640_HOLLE|nr:NXPE family member 3 [Holothuria leucospilota]